MEETTGEGVQFWDGHKSKTRENMTWCNDSDDDDNNYDHHQDRLIQLITPISASKQQQREGTLITSTKTDEIRTIICPSCGHSIHYQDQGGINDLPGLPAGVKFDPTDQEILEHLEAKVLSDMPKLHPLIDEFIPTLEGENGICYTHPEKLPGVNKDGQIRHFFHRPSKAYTTGTRKRRKVHTDEEGSETRWHKTGKTRAVFVGGGSVKGFKKILVLYTNYGRQKKPEKTNWVMHQYHLGNDEEEKDGELVVSKVFYQTQPRHCGSGGINDSSQLDHRKLKNRIGRHEVNDSHLAIKNKMALVDHQTFNNYPFISYDHGNHSNRESSPPQLIPNLVVQGDGSSFIQLASNTSKGKLERKSIQ